MKKLVQKLLNKLLRKARVRARVYGTAERPRLSVHISNKHVSAQIIDDDKHHTILGVTTVGSQREGSLSAKAAWVGEQIAKKAAKAKIKTVVFDRNGRRFAGRLKALADAARKQGLEF
ncbi:MAG: 50S ribosomal protein L18 [Candidatus Chaera renei]|uniref:Large ribosomal subunit protein uL18 n=1 Tax=Candidatus Chaera renei TaxID=2506947 RepID=A0A4Q0AJA7_9BACT|nr:MAG: 50S ribosomal protein L18 [Candidatus Chaera renei]